MSTNLLVFDQELDQFMQSVKGNDFENSKSINRLFNLLCNYHGKVNEDVYFERLLSLGDFLFSKQCYRLAALHCYLRLVGLMLEVNYIGDYNALFEASFTKCTAERNNTKIFTFLVRGLIGYASCICLNIFQEDLMLLNKQYVLQIFQMLRVLQKLTELALQKDCYCWLVYNGTVHIYTICRKLMTIGLSSHVLESLLWSCVCMESSVPLLTVKYLVWRVQLYAAVCQCYYDLKSSLEAEEFASRGLKKIEELKEINALSSFIKTPENDFIFKQSELKMTILIFKRTVFESRRKPKGFLRPKIKTLLKDILHNHWPRTGVERLLVERFAGRSTQLLAILEALTDTTRRVIQTGLSGPEVDESFQDVCNELFFAALEIISGGGGIKPTNTGRSERAITNYVINLCLIELASTDSQSITLAAVVKIVKLAYNYENWETFDALACPVVDELLMQGETKMFALEAKIIQLLVLMANINPSKMKRKSTAKDGDHVKTTYIDDLLKVAYLLDKTIYVEKLKFQCHCDVLVDVILLLWSKCKSYFSRVNSSVLKSNKVLYQAQNVDKWIKILIITQRCMLWLDVHHFDAAALAECSLKLACVLESLVNSQTRNNSSDQHNPVSVQSAASTLHGDHGSIMAVKTAVPEYEDLSSNQFTSLLEKIINYLELKNSSLHLLKYVEQILGGCLSAIDSTRDRKLLNEGVVADDSLLKSKDTNKANLLNLNLNAFHLDVVYQYFYIKNYVQFLSNEVFQQQINKKTKIKEKEVRKEKKSVDINSLTAIPSAYGKSDLYKALNMLAFVDVRNGLSQHQSFDEPLQETLELLQKGQRVEEKFRNDCDKLAILKCQTIPPPPVLVWRGSTVVSLKPVPFKPKDGELVAWYSLFLKDATGNNVKVRLGDKNFKGTGEQIPATTDCVFVVRNLIPRERYVAAVAAYNKMGKLIGGSIGQTSRPFLTTHSLPFILAYSYLAKTAYQQGVWVIAKSACKVMWDHFVEDNEIRQSEVMTVKQDYELTSIRLLSENIYNSSTVVLRNFVQAIFIMVDITSKEGGLYCDALCDDGSSSKSQKSRLEQSSRLLIALEVSGILNDSDLCLQSIVQIYGLLVPILYWKLPLVPSLEILSHVFSALQEICGTLKYKKQSKTTEALQHMVACLTNYIAKVLVQFEEIPSALNVLENGCKMLNDLIPPEHIASGNHDRDSGGLSGKKPQKNQKKGKGKTNLFKALNEFNSNSMFSRRALEIFQRKLEAYFRDRFKSEIVVLLTVASFTVESADNSFELTGAEDPIVLYAAISVLPPQQAYKEVLKFKRRTQFLESFVKVLTKALTEKLHDMIPDWTIESVAWLTKRNEIVLNKSTNNPRGIVIVAAPSEEGKENLKRFSAGVVEYGKPFRQMVGNTMSEIEESVGSLSVEESASSQLLKQDKQKQAPKRQLLSSPTSIEMADTIDCASTNTLESEATSKQQIKVFADKKPAAMSAIEKKRKDAQNCVQSILPAMWRMMQRRKKMRAVSWEELPWRSQMNLITAKCYLHSALEKHEILAKKLNVHSIHYQESLMDTNLITLSSTGTLMVSWSGCMKTEHLIYDKKVDIGGHTLEHQREARVTESSSDNSISAASTTSTSQSLVETPSSEMRQEELRKSFVQNLQLTFKHFQRAVVLSHRGHNWVLFQRACDDMLSATHTLIMRLIHFNSNIDTTKYDIPFFLHDLRLVVCKSFGLVAELIVDMLTQNKNYQLEVVQSKSFGDIQNNKGGSDLKRAGPFDHNSYLDYGGLKRLFMFAVEVMFYDKKWERLASVIMRFNALTRDRFSESLLPILVYAQRCLVNRLASHTDRACLQVTFDDVTGVPVQTRFVSVAPLAIPVGAHIDPQGHNLYTLPEDGLKYACVPTDFERTLKSIPHVLDKKPFMSRMLEHSRCLLVAYLAGRDSYVSQGRRLTRGGSSRVSFAPSQIYPPSTEPKDITLLAYKSLEELETYPLLDSQLAVLISSYDRCIEMLTNHNQMELAGQAMHELGNIMFHTKNTRAAYKWWSKALNCILQLKDSQKMWRTFVSKTNFTVNPYQGLLEQCGAWGCLLGGVVAVKIARYIHTTNIDLVEEMCHMAAALFKALFCSSLGHPSAYYAYASYNLSSDASSHRLLPGLNLFSDPHRIHCGNLTASLLWLSTFFVERSFNLQAQPILSLAEYFSTVICQDLTTSVSLKLLRVRSLCELQRFSEAIEHFTYLLSGNTLPGAADMIRRKTQIKWTSFDNAKGLDEQVNQDVLSKLQSYVLPELLKNVYGEALSTQISMTQASILILLASRLVELPQTRQDDSRNTVESTENNLNKSKVKERNKKSKDTTSIIKDTTSVIKDTTPIVSNSSAEVEENHLQKNLKTRLLASAEEILLTLKSIITRSNCPNDEVSTLVLHHSVRINIHLSMIYMERLLSAKAACAIYECLQMMSEKFQEHTIVNTEIDGKSGNKTPSQSLETTYEKCAHESFVNLWFKCRYLLCHYLHLQDNPIGGLRTTPAAQQTGSLVENLILGEKECQMFSNSSLKVGLKLFIIENKLRNGEDLQSLIRDLQILSEEILTFNDMSCDAKDTLINVQILLADLKTLKYGQLEEGALEYTRIEQDVLQQIACHGYNVSLKRNFPQLPLKNIYLSLFDQLLPLKVRCYRARAFYMTSSEQNEELMSQWLGLLDDVTYALEFWNLACSKEILIKLELLYLKGQIQRLLYDGDLFLLSSVVENFLDVIKTSKIFTADLSIIRQCYLEIALVFFATIKAKLGDLEEADVTSKARKKGWTTLKASPFSKSLIPNKPPNKEIQRLNKAAWVCIRAAGIILKAHRRMELLSGEAAITSLTMEDSEFQALPMFAIQDLLGVHSIEETASSKRVVLNVRNSDVEISWVHVLNYATYLRRNCSFASLVLTEKDFSITRVPHHTKWRAMKLMAVTRYLSSYLAVFNTECCPILPIEIIQSILAALHVPKKDISATNALESLTDEEKEKLAASNAMLITLTKLTETDSSTETGKTTALEAPAIGTDKRTTSERSSKSSEKKQSFDRLNRINLRVPASAGENEVVVQWYKPELEQTHRGYFYVMSAFNNKPIYGNSTSSSFAEAAFVSQVKVDENDALKLHHSIMDIVPLLEADVAVSDHRRSLSPISPALKNHSLTSASKTSPTKKQRVNKKQEKNDDMKSNVGVIIDNIKRLIKTDVTPGKEIASLEPSLNNMSCLENMFNPGVGHIARVDDTLFSFLQQIFNQK